MFSAVDQQMAAQVDDVNDHEKECRVTTVLSNLLHGGEQFRSAFLNGRGASRFYSANGKDSILNGKFLEVVSNESLSGFLVHIAGSGSENGLTKLLNILASDSGQFCGYPLIFRGAGGRAQNQSIIEEASQQQARDFTWNGNISFMIQASNDGSGTTDGFGTEHNWSGGMNIGDA